MVMATTHTHTSSPTSCTAPERLPVTWRLSQWHRHFVQSRQRRRRGGHVPERHWLVVLMLVVMVLWQWLLEMAMLQAVVAAVVPVTLQVGIQTIAVIIIRIIIIMNIIVVVV